MKKNEYTFTLSINTDKELSQKETLELSIFFKTAIEKVKMPNKFNKKLKDAEYSFTNNTSISLDKIIKTSQDDNPVIDKSLVIKPCIRLIREGTIGDCPDCGSTTVRKYGFFGKKIGCIQPKCKNYYKNKRG